MANCIGYEEISVGKGPKGPELTEGAALVAAVSGMPQPVCAVFKVSPESSAGVRWIPHGNRKDAAELVGMPLRPGQSIVVAGTGNIKNSEFASIDGKGTTIFALYYDQVDVIAFDGGGAGGFDLRPTEALLRDINNQLGRLSDQLPNKYTDL